MERQDIDQVILNHLQGEATTNEIEILRQWMSDHHENESTFNAVKSYWENSNLLVKSNDLDTAFAKFKAISSHENAVRTIHLIPVKKRRNIWIKFAAVFVVICTVVGLTYFMINSPEQTSETILVKEVVKENPKGQKLTTFLPDGSKVILNSQSRIVYNMPFSGDERLIQLEGEAYFEVKKDDQKPFRVIAKGVSTTALGTSFNVNSKNRNFVEVALVSGKVRVSKDPDHSVVLASGKSTIVTQNGGFEVSDFEIPEKVGWKDGLLVFKNNTLSEIIARLENWYGVNFITIGKLERDFHYSGKYNNETLEEVLHGISFVHHFEFKISGDTVKIYSNHKI